MKVDNNGLGFAGQRFSNTFGLNPNLHANPCASSGFTSTVLERHLCYLPLHRALLHDTPGTRKVTEYSIRRQPMVRSHVITLISTVIQWSTVPVATETREFQIVTALQTTGFGAPIFVVSC